MQQFWGPKLLMWKATLFIHVWQREKKQTKTKKTPQNLEIFFFSLICKDFFSELL